MLSLPDWTRLLVIGSALCATANGARAQCTEWKPGFGINGVAGLDPEVRALLAHDDGSGPALFIGGRFTTQDEALAIAKWDGSSVSTVGGGVRDTVFHDTRVNAFATFDDGSGSALYVGGRFTLAGDVPASNIARWDGTEWSALGTGVNCCGVDALAVFDDGSGPALFVGGQFSQAGGSTAWRIAKWDGASWSSLGAEIQGQVNALCVYDDGSGAQLYVGGSFTSVGAITTHSIARWDGVAWRSVAGGTGPGTGSGPVHALTVLDEWQGPVLIVGGGFEKIGGVLAQHVARWDGTSFTPVGAGLEGQAREVLSLAVHDDGTGAALYAGGTFQSAAGPAQINRIARFDGSDWSPLGTGMENGFPNPHGPKVAALTTFDDGSGAVLCAGGIFGRSGGNAIAHLAQWDGADWEQVIDGKGVDGPIRAFTVFDAGDGPALFAGGSFTNAGGVNARNIARWDGSQWSNLGNGLEQGFGNAVVHALAVYDHGAGPRLYAGGTFTLSVGVGTLNHVAAWDGASWSPVGGGVNGTVHALCVFDDGSGPALFVGGNFEFAGGAPIRCIAKWDGASWSAVSTGTYFDVRALAVWDDGRGDALYLGGTFTVADGQEIKYIAKWIGSTFEQVGAGIDRPVLALTVHDDGSGAALYAGGRGFTNNPAGPLMARWDGSSWTSLGSGIANPSSTVDALLSFDDGSGPVLYAGGEFESAGGVGARNFARWDGSAWSDVGGLDAQVTALASYDDLSGGGPDLYVGGEFTTASGKLATSVAELWRCNAPTPFCFGDGRDARVTTPCPCANFGDAGHGCGNSVSTGGALLSSSGTIAPDTLDFTVSDVPAGVSTTYLQGDALAAAGIVFGDGVRCAAGSLTRLGSRNDVDLDGSTSIGPGSGDAQISVAGSVVPGNTYWYQTSYRNPNPGWCPPATFNITNGLAISWF